jgi:hypothetical protein
MVVVFLICVQFDLDLSFSSCLRRLEHGPLAGFISVGPSVSQSPPAEAARSLSIYAPAATSVGLTAAGPVFLCCVQVVTLVTSLGAACRIRFCCKKYSFTC